MEGLEPGNAPVSWECRDLGLGVYLSKDLGIEACNSADSSPLSLASLSSAEPDRVSRPVAGCSNSKVTHSGFFHTCGYLDLSLLYSGSFERPL